jgi:hypothetical protein
MGDVASFRIDCTKPYALAVAELPKIWGVVNRIHSGQAARPHSPTGVLATFRQSRGSRAEDEGSSRSYLGPGRHLESPWLVCRARLESRPTASYRKPRTREADDSRPDQACWRREGHAESMAIFDLQTHCRDRTGGPGLFRSSPVRSTSCRRAPAGRRRSSPASRRSR